MRRRRRGPLKPPFPFKPVRENVSSSLVATWVPRGFAVVHSDAPGTGLSQGCVTVGSDPEQLAPKAIIDWLNGRAKGFKTIDGTEEVAATSWSTGKVGMTGTSYNGTIPLAAAVTGVKGLEAIIPVAPNTSYYHYYRSNGLVRHPGGWLGEDIDFLYDFINSGNPDKRDYCDRTYRDGEFARGRDRAHGDYNDFWATRDLLPKVKNIKAAVLMAHAFNDWNVVPEHSVRIYEALKGRVPLMAYYHQGGHGGSPPLEMMNKWFTRYLYGVENGIEREPEGVDRPRDQSDAPPPPPAEGAPPAAGRGRGRGAIPPPVPYADYPNPAASPVVLRPTAGGGRVGGLTTTAPSKQQPEKLVDNVEFAGAALAKADASENRLLYATGELDRASASVGHGARDPAALRRASQPRTCRYGWSCCRGPTGRSAPRTSSRAAGRIRRTTTSWSAAATITRRRPGSRSSRASSIRLTFDLEPDDQIIPAGKRIGLMIFSSDRDFTVWPRPGTELTIDIDKSTLTLPVVGGSAVFGKATS